MSSADNTVTVASTSDWMAQIRAEESKRDDAFLIDEFAHWLAGPADDPRSTALFELGPPTEAVPLRGRFGDAVLTKAVEAGVRQVVNLGAGSDSRPYRLGLADDVTVFEVDMPGLLQAKRAVFESAGLKPSCRLVSVEVDLKEDWPTALTEAGFAADEPTVWMVEGLFYYLESAAADQLLARVSALSVTGSWIELDIPHSRFLTEPANARFLSAMAARGVGFIGAVDEPVEWLHRHGWTAEAYLPADLVAGRGPVGEAAPERLNVPSRPIWFAVGRR